MEQSEAKQENPQFTTEEALVLCSWNCCVNGHKWKPTVALVECPGCKTADLMVKKENCPFCNDPISEFNLRSDYIPKGAGVAARCKGVQVYGESLDILLKRTQWREIEEKATKTNSDQSEQKSLIST